MTFWGRALSGVALAAPLLLACEPRVNAGGSNHAGLPLSEGSPVASTAQPAGTAQPTGTAGPTSSGPAAPGAPLPSSDGARSRWLAVADRESLGALEAAGYGLAENAFASPGPIAAASELAKLPGYAAIVGVLARDLAEFRAGDARLGVGMRHAHRAFDARWFSSPEFRFELSGVVNRMDRRVFAEHTCGELRFLYRLAYETRVHGQDVHSRVPMTVNLVRWLRPDQHGSCAAHERAFTQAVGKELDARALLAAGGPLDRARLARSSDIKSLEVNLQSVRWPSTVRPAMAGHAEYLMRVFTPQGQEAGSSYEPALLENTPDVARVSADRSLRADLLEWLVQPSVLAEIDRGNVRLPDRFLARRAVSISPHGLARLANRPFSQLVETASLSELELAPTQTIQNPALLLRRLDAMSCQGCHQTHSVAGFHFLGEDDASRRADVIAVAHSAHFGRELERRVAFRFDVADPIESAERTEAGRYGAHCGLDAQGPFAEWTCDAGLRCLGVGDPDVGICQPDAASPGDACETGKLRQSPHPQRDTMSLARPRDCGSSAVCERNGVGFPGGMCSAGCSGLADSSVCGGIAQLVEFNTCLARQRPFEACILENTRPGALRRCSEARPCREDYVCARLPSGEGGCIPPYFLFQMRVDGHVL